MMISAFPSYINYQRRLWGCHILILTATNQNAALSERKHPHKNNQPHYNFVHITDMVQMAMDFGLGTDIFAQKLAYGSGSTFLTRFWLAKMEEWHKAEQNGKFSRPKWFLLDLTHSWFTAIVHIIVIKEAILLSHMRAPAFTSEDLKPTDVFLRHQW